MLRERTATVFPGRGPAAAGPARAPATPGAALEVGQAQGLFHLAVVVFDAPAELGGADQSGRRGVGRQVGEPELNRFSPVGRCPSTRQAPQTDLPPPTLVVPRESIAPLPIHRPAAAHPDTAGAVFRKLLRKPGFTWSEDGEALLRCGKRWYYASEPRPGVSVIGDRLRTPAAGI